MASLMPRGVCRLAVAALSVVCLASVSHAQVATFAQITDAHLFDTAGGPAEQADYDALKHHAALLDTIVAINRLAASGTRLDFVVFTGDFGVASLAEDAIDVRAAEIGRAFRAVLSQQILVLPGDRDVADATGTREMFDRFLAGIRGAVGGRQLVDLTLMPTTVNGIDVLGLDSATLVRRVGGRPRSAASQLNAIARVRRSIRQGQAAILFTHIPPVQDPADTRNGQAASLWDLSPEASAAWDDVLAQRELLGVFAGHVHNFGRDKYGQAIDLSRGTVRPVAPLWVAPPLAGLQAAGAAVPAIGFLQSTVTTTGSVSVKIHWLPSDTFAEPPDSTSELFKARAYERAWELEKAESAYEKALASKDAAVRAAAESGFGRTRDQQRSWRWTFVENLAPVRLVKQHATLAFTATMLCLGLIGFSYWRPSPVLGTPVKLTSDAPAELFVEELLAAIDQARHVLDKERGLDIVSAGPNAIVIARAPADPLSDLLDNLPSVGGVKLGGFVASLMKYLRWFRRRLDLSIAGSATDLRAFGQLHHAWKVEAQWREPAVGDAPLDLIAAARRMAYDLIWERRYR
jgi:3',5'-cyclic AMP phosphodiesterase CpdA